MVRAWEQRKRDSYIHVRSFLVPVICNLDDCANLIRRISIRHRFCSNDHRMKHHHGARGSPK